jgi:SNF2 family DNA or RNA helicase
MLRQFLASGRMMLVFDESSRGKNPKATRTKSMLTLARYAAVRCILSGTPVTRGLEDLYTQFAFLDPKIIGMTNYWSFRNYYCILRSIPGAPANAMKIVGYRNVEDFVKKIAPTIFIVPKDVLGLPEKTYERRETTLTKEQEKIYNSLAKELLADLRARRIQTPANAAVRLIRLQQVLCGRMVTEADIVTDEGDEVRCLESEPIPNGRLETLLDVLGEHDGPAVIWCRFTDDIEDIKAMLEEEGHSVVTYYGATSDKDRREAVRKFKAGEARYFVANPGAAGTGLDGLQVAELAVYYSNAFDSEKRWQSEDRIHRLGMAGRAHFVDIVAPKTVDGMILDNLARKQNLARLVFDDPGALESEPVDRRELEDA